MRLVYEGSKTVGPKPVNHYVYLWRHGEIDRYVGAGKNREWATHTKPDCHDYEPKCNYFLEHLPGMTCSIIAEGLSLVDAFALELKEIDRIGLLVDRTGTLLNARRGSVITGPRGKRDLGDTSPSYQRYRKRKEQGRITLNAVLRRASNHLKKWGSPGARYQKLYPPLGETTTVEKLLAKGLAQKPPFTATAQHNHLLWDFDHDYIAFELPDGEVVMPGYIFPTKATVLKDG
jgi:hypothetical protein